jgi:calreticulin
MDAVMLQVLIDNEKVEGGELEADWNFLPPRKIKDPDASKPEDWDDRASIDDPEDSKPEDWEQPEHIADPDATKPEDWDDEMDGEWEPPMIDNPAYKGEWKPKQIDNPAYKVIHQSHVHACSSCMDLFYHKNEVQY